MKTDWFLVLLALALVAATGSRYNLPLTHTFKEGESLASATNALCAGSGVSGWLSRGRWYRWPMVRGNKALSDPSRWLKGPSDMDIVVHAGETYQVPENLCAPFLYKTEIAALILAIIMMIRAYRGTEVVEKEAMRGVPAGRPVGAT
ncbi:MAG: hypothetical protein V2A55_02425 [Candidatus Jorgensenbacteria bacterium]